MLIMRPGQQLYIPGVQVLETKPPTTSNWWEVSGQTCVAAYQPKGAADLASSYINLANPGTNNAAPGVAPTWDVTGGWTFNGTTQFLTTGAVPSNNWSMIARFSNGALSGTRCVVGTFLAGNPRRFFVFSADPGGHAYGYGNQYLAIANALSSGVLALTSTNGYLNGVSEVSFSSTWTTPYAIFVGASNNNGTAASFFSGKIQAVAIYSTTLSAGNVASLTSAMNAL